MSELRPEISIALLNERGAEYLPGYLGIKIIALSANSLTGRMPVQKLHFAPNNLKSNHVGTIEEGTIACVASAQHLGRNTQVWDAIVTDEATGRKIALFRCTQMILWPKS